LFDILGPGGNGGTSGVLELTTTEGYDRLRGNGSDGGGIGLGHDGLGDRALGLLSGNIGALLKRRRRGLLKKNEKENGRSMGSYWVVQ